LEVRWHDAAALALVRHEPAAQGQLVEGAGDHVGEDGRVVPPRPQHVNRHCAAPATCAGRQVSTGTSVASARPVTALAPRPIARKTPGRVTRRISAHPIPAAATTAYMAGKIHRSGE